MHDDSIYAGMTPLPLQVYIGYDPLETCAYHVLAQSIIEHATQPVQIVAVALAIPILRSTLRASAIA